MLMAIGSYAAGIEEIVTAKYIVNCDIACPDMAADLNVWCNANEIFEYSSLPKWSHEILLDQPRSAPTF
jgi:hypothetical protein